MRSELIALNGFEKADNGVFQSTTQQPFDYSDGESVEQRLDAILRNASDLSSDSTELEAQICDWPTEYHLSSARANLLRPLNLLATTDSANTDADSNKIRVLELGCGCGSISRYLGEQDSLEVDSVEGSGVRAGLARLRCRDLENVTISHGNFNEMQFPEAHYDLVLFVGVTEYAGRFSEKETDQEALQDLLTLAKKAVKAGGVVAIAIENRLGLKYLLGACEDHYGQEFVGLDNYPESTGIRTYSRSEWLEQIGESNFANSHFIYPFPDYKVPTLMVNANCAQGLSDAYLRNIVSRDYLRTFENAHTEAPLWQGINQANQLGEFANSFLILLGESGKLLTNVADFAVVNYTNTRFDWHLNAQRALDQQTDVDEKNYDASEHVSILLDSADQLQQHAEQLEQKVALITGSFGWRVLNRLRRLFGRSTPF